MKDKILIIISENGTSLVNLTTGEAWLNKDRPLQYHVGDKGVWVNAPCTLSLEHWNSMKYPHVVFQYYVESFNSEKRNEMAKTSDNIFIETNGPNCICCGAHDRGLYGYPCIHCEFDLNKYRK